MKCNICGGVIPHDRGCSADPHPDGPFSGRHTAAPNDALAVLASFAHQVVMGVYRSNELRDKAKEALKRAGLLRLDAVVALNECAAAPPQAAPAEPLDNGKPPPPEGWGDVSNTELVRRQVEITKKILAAEAQAAQEPLFWYRPVGNDGGYEGPIHNASIEKVRRESGAWKPLYTVPQAQAAQPEKRRPMTDDERRGIVMSAYDVQDAIVMTERHHGIKGEQHE